MTFVPQPFEQFVDELLTAMTGGFVREEHRFEGVGDTYPISAASALAESVRVVGERGGAFHAFERGLDFQYVAGEAAVQWIEGGSVPDDRSFFYVNYYPTERDRRLTDRNIGSVTRTLGEAFARQFAVLHQQMEVIYRSAFVEFANDSSLDHVAALLDITRRDARFASGEVLFKRSTPAPATIVIPSGTLVSTLDGRVFEATEERRVRRGQLSVTVPIRARESGTGGAVPAESITVLNEPLLGIESVVNTEATHFDAARETDPELRRRIRGSLERAGRATRNAILQTLIQEIPAINENNVRVVERLGEPGLVELQFGLTDVDEETVRRIDDAIFRSRAAGVRVVHNLGAQPSAPGPAALAKPAEPGREEREGTPRAPTVPPPEELANLPEGVLPLRIEVLYRLAAGDLSPAERDEVEDGIRERLSGYVESVGMDSDLIHSKLVGRVVEPEVIQDATVRIGVSGGPSLYAENLATAGRKAAIANPQGDVFVGPMREIVRLDVAIAVETPADGGATPDALRWGQTVKDALSAALPERNATQLGATEIARVAGSALEAGPYRLAQGRPVTLDATFDESGRFLSAPETIDLAPHHEVRFDKVILEAGSPLDG